MKTTTMNNTTANIGYNILTDVIGSVGTTSFVKTFVDAYKRGISKRTFTLRQWKVMKEIFRDHESCWDAIFEKLDVPCVQFAESKNGDEDYNIFTIYRNHNYDHWNHGYERLVVKEN